MSSILDTSREQDLCKVESWALELGDVLRLEVYIESHLYKYCHETASRDQICKEWPYRERKEEGYQKQGCHSSNAHSFVVVGFFVFRFGLMIGGSGPNTGQGGGKKSMIVQCH